MAISIDYSTYIITVPRTDMTLVQSNPIEIRELDMNAFHLTLRGLEDDFAGMPEPDTHNYRDPFTISGIQLARIVEILAPYTVTFEDGQYAVNLVNANTNLQDKVNINQVSVRPSNSAGLIQTRELEQSSYNSRVTIDALNGVAGTAYPIGTLQQPVNNLADAQFIATQRGLDSLYVIGNLTIGATDSLANYNVYGKGATFNVAKTVITLTAGCSTSSTHFYDCKIEGTQGGETNFHDCLIGAMFNTHCFYERCKMVGPIAVTDFASSTHQTAYFDCYSGFQQVVIDQAGSRLNKVFNNWNGKLKFINCTHADFICEINIVAGEVELDSSCTAGTFTIRGNGHLINNSVGATVDAESVTTEGFDALRLYVESARSTHQGFGETFYVDPVNGNDANAGTAQTTPFLTVNAALTAAVSGRGDVIFLIAPGAGAATINERIDITKEDIHIRGPGRGVQFQPSTTGLGPVIRVSANNCSLSGFIVRSPVGELVDDAVVVDGKFVRMEKLYLVGPGQALVGSTSRGIVITAGDYHEFYDMEVEKFPGCGFETDDANTANGNPREITISGGNWYLNGGNGICLTGRAGAALGTTTRIIRIVGATNVHANTGFGISTSANTDQVLIGNNVMVHGNNGGHMMPQYDFQGDVHNEIEERPEATAVAVWDYQTTDITTVGSIGLFVKNKLLTVGKFLGLK